MWDFPPFDPAVEMSVASRGMSKGIAQTDGPQAVAKISAQLGSLQLGGQWKNVDSPTADGEAAAFVSAGHRFGGLQLTLGAAYKFQTGVTGGVDSDAFELSAAATRKFGKLSLRLSAVYSPDDLGGTRRSLYIEGGPAIDLTSTLRLSANLGHRSRQGSSPYTSFNAGVTKTLFHGFALDVRYYSTNRSELGISYHRRAVIMGRWSF